MKIISVVGMMAMGSLATMSIGGECALTGSFAIITWLTVVSASIVIIKKGAK
jgi:hypothetical protein